MEVRSERVQEILDTLLKYVQGNFRHKISISDKGDEFDAIAYGLNAMAEELKAREDQLMESKSQLEGLNKELEAFSYSISHDLRAPLRAITGYSKILEEDCADVLNEEGRRALGIIQKNATKMNCLIDDLLNFSKIGKKEILKTEVNTEQVVQAALHEANDALQYPADVVVKPLIPMQGDKALLTQVWINLISNALKYSAKAEAPRIEIGSHNAETETVYYVKDNGAGFDMQYADKLFGIFQRLHNAQEYQGTGVGLSIVQRIIKKHNGRVWAEGKINEGAIFYFSLPT